jgi:hypothetical protein
MKTYWGNGCIAPCILDLGTRWRWVVSFTPRPLYPKKKSPWYPLDRRLGGPQSRSGRGGEEKNSQTPPGIEPPNSDRSARSQARYRLSYHGIFELGNSPPPQYTSHSLPLTRSTEMGMFSDSFLTYWMTPFQLHRLFSVKSKKVKAVPLLQLSTRPSRRTRGKEV